MNISQQDTCDYLDSEGIQRESALWREACKEHNVTSYARYLDQSHLRLFADEASALIDHLLTDVGTAKAETAGSTTSEDTFSPGRRTIREIYELLPALKHDTQFLYRYGNLAGAGDKFYALSPVDQRRLAYLAATAPDEDLVNIGKFLMSRIEPKASTISELRFKLAHDLCLRIVASGEPRTEKYLGVTITDGTRRFSDDERERIEDLLVITPPQHLKMIAAIRAVESLEPWIGRYLSHKQVIELNEDWENTTLIHEIGHAMAEGFSDDDKNEWETLYERGRDESD